MYKGEGMKIDKAVIEKCADTELRLVLEKLLPYQEYCLLEKGDITAYVKVFESLGKMPKQLKEWLKIFDGGELFSVSMFFADIKKGEEKKLLTYEEVNSVKFKEENGIPQEIQCFAMTNYGNYYCFANDDEEECIYEWDCERCGLIIKWDSFAEWLNEQIENGQSDIEEGLLSPMKG